MGNMCPAFIWCTDKYGIPRGLGKVHPFALEVELVIAVSICGTTVHHVWDTRVLVQYFCVVYFLTSGWPFGGHLLVLIAPCTQCAWSLPNGHGPNHELQSLLATLHPPGTSTTHTTYATFLQPSNMHFPFLCLLVFRLFKCKSERFLRKSVVSSFSRCTRRAYYWQVSGQPHHFVTSL